MTDPVPAEPVDIVCDGDETAPGRWIPVVVLNGIEVWRDSIAREKRSLAMSTAQGRLSRVLRRLLDDG